MAQFDVHRNTSPRSREHTPFVLVIQADLLDDLDPCVVVPLRRAERMTKPISRLNPQFKVQGMTVVMMTNSLAGVARRELGEVVANLEDRRDVIIAAIDTLLSGI